jgi:leader peptidase (prepilin peptidase)/N-methyltransferase
VRIAGNGDGLDHYVPLSFGYRPAGSPPGTPVAGSLHRAGWGRPVVIMKLPSVIASRGSGRAGPPAVFRLLAGLALAPLLRLIIATHSVPAGRGRRVACDGCATPLGFPHGLRPFSPVARCTRCRARIGAPPYTVEVALLGVVLTLAAVDRPVVELLALAGWLAVAVPLAFIDTAVHRLPDRLTWPAAIGTWALLGVAAALDHDPAPWVRALAVGLGLALLLAASTFLLGRRGFGLGDAKLALSAGAVLGWLGWGALITGLFVTFVCSALVSLALLVTGRVRWSGHVPFGPFLILGTVAAVLLSA